MNDFIKFVLGEAKDALILAIVAVLFCVIAMTVFYVVHKWKYKNTKPFSWKKPLTMILSVGYLAVLLYATLMRMGGGYGTNFHLFRAWREAWNLFSYQSWLNLLLNIALFMPLGVLLPLLFKPFQKWYWMLGAGVGASLIIEVAQLALHRGIFDVDDLFANTLGAMFAYGVLMAVRTLMRGGSSGKKRLRAIAYATVPLATVLVIAGIFIAYDVKPYGNLPNAPTYRVSAKGIEWVARCALDAERPTVSMYRGQSLTKESCDAFGQAFFDRLGVTKELDIAYYDREAYFMDHQFHTLAVSYEDGSYTYHYFSDYEFEAGHIGREELEEKLAAYGIEIPQNANFSDEGDGLYLFEVPRTPPGVDAVGGMLSCKYSAHGEITQIRNELVVCKYEAEEEILSQKEAFEKLRKGDFYWATWEFSDSKAVEVLSCSIVYEVDTKGFYQPVYAFEVLIDSQTSAEFRVPALP